MKPDKMFFGGFRLDEATIPLNNLPTQRTDVLIMVLGWETRAEALLISGRVTGQHCLIIDFENGPGTDENRSRLLALAKRHFAQAELVHLADPLQFEKVMSDTERLAQKVIQIKPQICAVDYTALPKVVTQTLFRQFMLEGLCPIVRWYYLAGLYDKTPAVAEEFNQGNPRFFSVRGAEGSGGTSTQRIAIIGLGAERPLIDAFLRKFNYDQLHCLHAWSTHSPELMQRIQSTIDWLQNEHGIPETAFVKCEAGNVLVALKSFVSILADYPEDSGSTIDVFCAGPKSHALAASALVTTFGHVRLVARAPVEYARYEVPPAGEVSITTVADYTNPQIANAIRRR